MIDCEFDENRQPILDRIRKNITYYLGNAVEFHLLSKAAETLFNRDYKDKKQIFVPECFISKNPEILFYEKEELEKLLKTMSDDDMSKAEKGKMRCRIKTMEGEALEKNVYDTLKSYFQRHSGQHVLVIHGYEIMDLSMPEGGKKVIQHWEKDFIVINATYGYVLNIEAKKTLNGKSMKLAKEQIEGTKRLLEEWFGADLVAGWVFIGAVYCERDLNNCCQSCDMNYVFGGPEDMVEKLERLHNNLQRQNILVDQDSGPNASASRPFTKLRKRFKRVYDIFPYIFLFVLG